MADGTQFPAEAEVEGQHFFGSDETIKQEIAQVEEATDRLVALLAAEEPEVEGQHFTASDENLKQQVMQVKAAVAALLAAVQAGQSSTPQAGR